MLYTITEAAKQLQVSRVTVYKKIESIKDLKSHVKIKNNIKYIDDTGLDIIKLSMANNSDSKVDTEEEIDEAVKQSNETYSEQFTDLQDKYINSLQSQIEYLKNELEVKNKLISDQARMIENSQVLLRDNQQKILMLEDKVKEAAEIKPKGFLKKIFG